MIMYLSIFGVKISKIMIWRKNAKFRQQPLAQLLLPPPTFPSPCVSWIIRHWSVHTVRRCTAMQVQEMEWDKKDLERQLNELKLKFEQAERAAAEQRQVDEKKHAEEIQFLKRTNQQLKVCRNKSPE